jgi:hypothetical protein
VEYIVQEQDLGPWELQNGGAARRRPDVRKYQSSLTGGEVRY